MVINYTVHIPNFGHIRARSRHWLAGNHISRETGGKRPFKVNQQAALRVRSSGLLHSSHRLRKCPTFIEFNKIAFNF